MVRRPTGGRAVWHAEELTYAVAVPRDALGGLRDAYREIHPCCSTHFVCSASRQSWRRPARRRGSDAGACFASPAGGEIMIGGRKVVGSAQLREGAGLLQHGSILLTGRQTWCSEVTRGGGPPDLAGALAEALGPRPEPREVAERRHRGGGALGR